MMNSKRACLVYVTATAGMRAEARARLENEGYAVCEVLADIDAAIAADLGEGDIPADLKACIDAAEICVFLLPEDATGDGCIGAGGGYASELGKSFIAVVEGARTALPDVFDADAAGIVPDCGEGLVDAIKGDPAFKNPDGTKVNERSIKHIRCQ